MKAKQSGRSLSWDDLELTVHGDTYEKNQVRTNFAVFVLFFGIATLEAFQTRNWLKAALWLAIGTVFLVADNLKVKHQLH
jgi:hypothetical protein